MYNYLEGAGPKWGTIFLSPPFHKAHFCTVYGRAKNNACSMARHGDHHKYLNDQHVTSQQGFWIFLLDYKAKMAKCDWNFLIMQKNMQDDVNITREKKAKKHFFHAVLIAIECCSSALLSYQTLSRSLTL